MSEEKEHVRIGLIGPLPPPINGQSMVTSRIADELSNCAFSVQTVDTSNGVRSRGIFLPLLAVYQTVRALSVVYAADVVYIAVKAGHGMWLTTFLTIAARLMGAEIFLHHHSYLYVSERLLRMVALVRAAGPDSTHIVLSQSMARDLRATMPELNKLLVLGNAGLVDPLLLNVPRKQDGDPVVVGHMSNLSPEKGISEVIDLVLALRDSGCEVRLVVAGPAETRETRDELLRAADNLGQLFEYRGPVAGTQKLDFYRDISHFAFPTRYAHEAAPLVLYEAMAAGVVCVATSCGSIAEQLEGSVGIITDSADVFVGQALPIMQKATVRTADSIQVRGAFLAALEEFEGQFQAFVGHLSAQD
ncbi:hypothetical protein MPNTM1_05598 [Mycolicibacterium parafortuitum]|uniref:glycosyltransferase family 4 protein n=1 Tax=Mycolicibacterium parafortuitum TaxID=39692 RepID=UPI0032C3ED67